VVQLLYSDFLGQKVMLPNNVDQLYNQDFLKILKENIKTDSFGSENSIDQKKLLMQTFHTLFLENLSWPETFQRLNSVRNDFKNAHINAWLGDVLNLYSLYLFLEKNVSLRAFIDISGHELSNLLLYFRHQCLQFSANKVLELNHYFGQLPRLLQYQDVYFRDILDHLGVNKAEKIPPKLLSESLPYIESKWLVQISHTLNEDLQKEARSMWKAVDWKNAEEFLGYWKFFILQILLLSIVTIIIFFVMKKVNTIYEKIIIDKITLLEPNLLWLDTKLIFKNETDVPQKEIRLTSTQIDDLESLERIEQTESKVSDFFPESDIIDTSVAIGGWGEQMQDYNSSEVEVESGNDYRDRYYGFAKAYRLMLNSADLFDMRLKLINLFKRYNVKEANIPAVGRETLEGVYFNVYIPSKKIQEFISEVAVSESTNTYISKTSQIPPKGYERVFIWVKKI